MPLTVNHATPLVDFPRFTRDATAMPFTAETARIAAKLSLAAKMEAKLRPPKPIQHEQAVLPACPADDFMVRKLARIRNQIDRVEGLLDDADEPQAVDRFANALTRLYDLERILAGRPLPGTRRPVADGKRDRTQAQASAGPWLPAEAVVEPAGQLRPAPAALPARPLGWEYNEPTGAPAIEPVKLPGNVNP